MLWRRFARDARGGIAILAAIFMMATLTGVGATLDYVSLSKTRAAAQRALDASALRGSKALGDEAGAAIQELVDSTFESNMGPALDKIAYAITPTVSGGRIDLRLDMRVDMTFAKILGQNTAGVTLHSAAATSGLMSPPPHIGLALDISSSMSGQPLIDLKSAVLEALELFREHDGEVLITIIPYWQYYSNANYNYFIKSKSIHDDYDEIRSFVQNIEVRYSTPRHSHGGVACGWDTIPAVRAEMLASSDPEGTALILMHDGDGYCGRNAEILQECQRTRDAGIKMIAAQFGVYFDSARIQFFQDCAGGEDGYYDARDARGMLDAFLGASGSHTRTVLLR